MKRVREGDTLPKVEKTVTQDRIDRYAEASGDFNPIHVDQDFAAGSHFGGTVAHGMMVAASISEMMTAAFGTDWLRSGRLKLRFRAPVLPGDTVRAFGAVKRVRQLDGATEVACSVGVRRQNDESAVTGDATVTLASAGSTS
ncbi:MAG: MaoC family dehydratase [Chloroflexi bacterium]|nr:MaoC family dehydratase [Chloroflexota bacterium]